MLLFQFHTTRGGVTNQRRLCEKRIITFLARSDAAAMRHATRYGKTQHYSYVSATKHRVRFQFVGVMDLLELGIESAPEETWYDICTMLRPMERRGRLTLGRRRSR